MARHAGSQTLKRVMWAGSWSRETCLASDGRWSRQLSRSTTRDPGNTCRIAWRTAPERCIAGLLAPLPSSVFRPPRHRRPCAPLLN